MAGRLRFEGRDQSLQSRFAEQQRAETLVHVASMAHVVDIQTVALLVVPVDDAVRLDAVRSEPGKLELQFVAEKGVLTEFPNRLANMAPDLGVQFTDERR